MENLWKGLESLQTRISNPVDLVEEQASFLSDGTREVLELEIDEVHRLGAKSREVLNQVDIDEQFAYRVALASSYLPDYSYNIFTFFYDITFYPLVMSVPREIGIEVGLIVGAVEAIEETETRMYLKISDEEAFTSVMGNIFNSEKARLVMTNIKAIVGKNVLDEE